MDPLEKLGFSEYERKAYLALLKKNPVTGYELARTSGVPRSRIYETLERLEVKGAVLVNRQEPSLYAPVHPRELAKRLREEWENALSWLEEKAISLSKGGLFSSFWSLEGRSAILTRAKSMIDAAQESVYLVAGGHSLPELDRSVRMALKRGIRVILIACSPIEITDVNIFSHEDCAPDAVNYLTLCVDGKEILVGEIYPVETCRAAWSQNPAFIYLSEDYVRHEVLVQSLRKVAQEDELSFFSRVKTQVDQIVPFSRRE